MKNVFPPRFLKIGVLALCLGVPALVQAQVKDELLNVSEGALLTTLPNWTFNGDQDAWTISAGGKYGGLIEARTAGTYHRRLEGGEVLDPAQPPYVFKAKICIAGSDSWADARLCLLQSGGVNGMGISFSGGQNDGTSDNTIAISEGGTSWGETKFKTAAEGWQANTWYQVEIRDLRWDGGTLAGSVTVFPVDDPSQKLVDKAPIGVFGDPASFAKVDILSVASVGAARELQVSDIEFGPEAAKGASR